MGGSIRESESKRGRVGRVLDAGKTTSTSFSEHVAEWTCLFMLGV